MPYHFYNQHAYELANQYQALDFDIVHGVWRHWLTPYLKKRHAAFLDVGAGAGRDAQFFALSGNEPRVVAVEPAASLRRMGEAYTRTLPIEWVDDALPRLSKLLPREERFDLILLSSVLTQLEDTAIVQSLLVLKQLMCSDGLLVISIKHGQDEAELSARKTRILTPQALQNLACKARLQCVFEALNEPDIMLRDGISWHYLLFKLAADATP
ncbi:class I SAM-dependent methyltransferase [Pseudoalteromonas fenneropenaei]|uniref:Class I SAM-dependent methyltransferase n=1 Tax=Pseudoalteromonas fenneropenaei TaxID=1737459 RepID=A0ABV7CPY3_9GAMM